MRKTTSGDTLMLRAIAGLHVTTLAWDFVDPDWSKRTDLLGFAVGRARIKDDGALVDFHWLPGIKRFRGVDSELKPGTPVPTSKHPVQSFQWGDYTAEPDTLYEYTVSPVVGLPGAATTDRASEQKVRVRTECATAPTDDGGARHDVHFNRGVAGSQAYARKFPDTVPDETKPLSPQMAWLSRGLYEALIGFIGRASGADAARYGLRAMLYEFHYAPVAQAFKRASDDGADVAIRYEAETYKGVNETVIGTVGIGHICRPQKERGGIRHNKFIVILRDDAPVAVWTGSTNISAGGIFGHSNVGHVIHDEAIARRYLDYWDALAADDVDTEGLRARNMDVEPTPALGEAAPSDRVATYFSPRDGNGGRTAATLA